MSEKTKYVVFCLLMFVIIVCIVGMNFSKKEGLTSDMTEFLNKEMKQGNIYITKKKDFIIIVDEHNGEYAFVLQNITHAEPITLNIIYGSTNINTSNPALAKDIIQDVFKQKDTNTIELFEISNKNTNLGSGLINEPLGSGKIILTKQYVLYSPSGNIDDTKNYLSSVLYSSQQSTQTDKPKDTTHTNKKIKTTSYDNYNHYTGTATPTVFHGPNGEIAKVTTMNGVAVIIVTDKDGDNSVFKVNPKESNKSGTKKYTEHIYYGPHGGYAILLTNKENDEEIIKVVFPDGTEMVYKNKPTHHHNSNISQHINYKEMAANSEAYLDGNYVGKGKKPKHHKVYDNEFEKEMANNENGMYDDYLPKGIPKSMIPPGNEDMYILKTEVVPPVCPACPVCPNISSTSDTKSAPAPVPAPASTTKSSSSTSASSKSSNSTSSSSTTSLAPSPLSSAEMANLSGPATSGPIPVPMLNSFSSFR